jgi:TfoX/Sxy family transcriptional regulator of competence genes
LSTSKQTIAFIEDQLSDLDIRTKSRFGEYGIYCDGKVVGFICDDTLFIKPSSADGLVQKRTVLAPPYPGAKDYNSVPGDVLEDGDWLRNVIQAVADALPAPVPKKAGAQRKPKAAPPSSGGSGW